MEELLKSNTVTDEALYVSIELLTFVFHIIHF